MSSWLKDSPEDLAALSEFIGKIKAKVIEQNH
jgi:hypothetical protein